jgi:hypothetical protein
MNCFFGSTRHISWENKKTELLSQKDRILKHHKKLNIVNIFHIIFATELLIYIHEVKFIMDAKWTKKYKLTDGRIKIK